TRPWRRTPPSSSLLCGRDEVTRWHGAPRPAPRFPLPRRPPCIPLHPRLQTNDPPSTFSPRVPGYPTAMTRSSTGSDPFRLTTTSAPPTGRAPKTTDHRRVCAHPTCTTVLSRYNLSESCRIHEPPRFPLVRGVPSDVH